MAASIRHLRMFLVLGRTNSVTRAAESNHVSQPAVTQAMAKLARDSGHALFQRSPQGLFLTEAGEILHHRADRALRMLDRAMADMDRAIRIQATWQQLVALIAVTETENFTLAARRLGLAQPTVHRSTTMLEDAAGTVFFQRTAHGLIATRAALQLAQAARLALAELEQAESDLAALDGREVGRIVIGALPLSRSGWLPRAILAFRKARPSFPFQVIDGRYDELLLGLRRGEIDMMLGALRLPSPIEDIEQRRLFDDEVVVVARRDHPLIWKADPGIQDLAAYPWVMPRRSTPLRRILDTYFAARAPVDIVETSSVIMMREILRESDHLGGVSRMQAEVESEALSILPVRLPNAMRPIGITTRAGWEPTRTQRDFMDQLCRTAALLS
ncbi:DNA-binding transcriptional LysR family regulator [Paracoccus pantotrophus]|uniref:DNA-binding transcriptional LysR family regulator n=1 Tax=Paracoccus pantotrophus TaxID=82367 RepID=A0AAE6TWH8_PARPN|nr:MULTISPECIES: LysR family transcriptional regulator [Paracoccus]QFG37320.1 LysR family transcriptional regulator [Paracoccus pantotrophus]RKS52246.1 DNA-binding transcriptional LysR family regulator [Paracoccus pantotrophus]UFS67319.1 LysR family transcriptional regulator [Paracoccus denitrificans]